MGHRITWLILLLLLPIASFSKVKYNYKPSIYIGLIKVDDILFNKQFSFDIKPDVFETEWYVFEGDFNFNRKFYPYIGPPLDQYTQVFDYGFNSPLKFKNRIHLVYFIGLQTSVYNFEPDENRTNPYTELTLVLNI